MCDCCAEHMRDKMVQVYIDHVTNLDIFIDLEKILSQMPGVLMSEFLPELNKARVTYDSRITDSGRIGKEINSSGYDLLD